MEKKGVLLLVSILLVLGLAGFAEAKGNWRLMNATIMNITNSSGTLLYEYTNGFYLKNNSGTNLAGSFNNQTYMFNVSINLSSLGEEITFNVTNITVELPTGLIFSAVGDQYNITSGAGLIPTFNRTVNSTSYITWIGTSYIVNASRPESSGVNATVTLLFNATILDSAATEGVKNMTVRVSNNTACYNGATTCIGTNHSVTYNFTIIHNFTLDFTRPTISAASTNSTLSQINITFSELINASEITGLFNVTNISVACSGATRIVTTAALVGRALTDIESKDFALALNESYCANSTPVVYINASGGGIKDLAGNYISTNITLGSGASSVNTTASDRAGPGMNTSGLSYNDITNQLVLGFNEPVDPSTINLSQINISAVNADLTRIRANYTMNLTGGATISVTGGNNTIILILGQGHADNISQWRSVGLNLTANFTFIKDMAGNYLVPYGIGASRLNDTNNTIRNIGAITYDNVSANITAISYDEHTGNLTLTFNKTMASSEINLSNIEIWNDSSRVAFVNLTGSTEYKGHNSTFITFNLASRRTNVSYWIMGSSSPTFYVMYFNASTTGTVLGANFKTLQGALTNASNPNVSSNITIGTFTVKASPPTLAQAIFWNSTFGTAYFGRYDFIKAGVNNFSIVFNDTMSIASTGTVNITTASGSTLSPTCTWINGTMLNCTVTVTTSSGEGQATINVASQKLANRVTTMTVANTSNKVNIDTVAPTLLRVAYDDLNNTDDYNLSKDSLLLQFSENVTAVSAAGVRDAQGRRNTEPNGQIFNLTVNGNAFNGTFNAEELSNFSINATVLGVRNNSFINISLINIIKDVNLTPRGLASDTLTKDRNSSGFAVAAGQNIVYDYAGNLLVYNGRHDVADEMLEFQANALKHVSFPYCIDTTTISNQTSTVTAACSSYTRNAWSTVTSGQFTPLFGYKCNVTTDFVLYVASKKQSECALEDHNLTIDQHYNLLGIDNINMTNMTLLFNSMGDGSEVANLYADMDTGATNMLTTVGQYSAKLLNPYNAYWVFPDFTATTKQFNGMGYN